jgi:uncharacterized membrane protein
MLAGSMPGPVSVRRTVLDWSFEAVSLAALLGTLAFAAWHWGDLPAKVPQHFGVSGKPDSWGGKAILAILPLTSLIVYFGLTLASRYQQLINLPSSADRERPEVRQLLLTFVTVVKAEVTVLLFYITWATVETALGRANGLGKLLAPLTPITIFGTIAFYLWKLKPYRH